jgi:glycosyltransferase involved in cell wall biosynthesis
VRIAYVIPAYPPAPAQPFVVNEMIEVQEAGHEIVLLPLYATRSWPVTHGTYARLRPVEVLPAALVDVRDLGLALWTFVRHPLRVLSTLFTLHRAAGRNPYAHARLLVVAPKALAAAWRLRRSNVARIHAHFANQTADCAAIAGTVSGIPFSFTAHAYDIYSRAPRHRNETLGWKLARAVQVFTVNDYAAGLLREFLPAGVRDRVQTVYVGIPMHLFCVEPMPPRDGTLRLLSVARFAETKGLETLIDACGLLRDRGVAFELRLYGDGPLRDRLAARIAERELGDHVHLERPIPQEAVAAEMRACHVFVLPCRRDRSGDMDGIPTVFIEAMATGRPVVSCPVSGIPELVRDGETGLLVPADDPVALAAALARLADDAALTATLGRQARALVERQHDQQTNARRLLALMARVSSPGPTAGPEVPTRELASSRHRQRG